MSFYLICHFVKFFSTSHPAGTVLPISSTAYNVAVRIGERVYKGAGCCMHILIKGKKSVVILLWYLSYKKFLNMPIK